MTVVALDDGGLALISPVSIDDGLAAEIDALGTVRAVIAPVVASAAATPDDWRR